MLGSTISRRRMASLLGSGLLPTILPMDATLAQSAPQENHRMGIRATFAGQTLTITMADNPSARDLLALLPLELKISDYSTNEKIAYLPRKLTEEGSGRFGNEAPGDFAYYAPWGNIVFYYAPYRYSSGLIRLGRIEGSVELLKTRGEFSLRIERTV